AYELGCQASGELCAQPATFAGRVPSAENQRARRDLQYGRSILRSRFGKPSTHCAFHERLVTEKTVTQDRVVDAMRRIQRCNSGDSLEIGRASCRERVR